MKKIMFLEYVITMQGIEMDKEKAKVILDWPTLKSVI
jgi:hypothetical protein